MVSGEHTASTRPTYWHGGVPGLQVGKLLLPPALTGVRPNSALLTSLELQRVAPRADRVYLFDEGLLAALWAALHGQGAALGWVYEVVPEGGLEADPDPTFARGASWECERARIVSAQPLDAEGFALVRRAVAGFNRLRRGGVA